MSRTASRAAVAAGFALLIGLASAPAEAKTCKAEITAKSTSRAEFSQERRARERALANWRKKAQATNGIAYRFWTLAEDKSIKCNKAAKSTTCVATAKPCSPL